MELSEKEAIQGVARIAGWSLFVRRGWYVVKNWTVFVSRNGFRYFETGASHGDRPRNSALLYPSAVESEEGIPLLAIGEDASKKLPISCRSPETAR